MHDKELVSTSTKCWGENIRLNREQVTDPKSITDSPRALSSL